MSRLDESFEDDYFTMAVDVTPQRPPDDWGKHATWTPPRKGLHHRHAAQRDSPFQLYKKQDSASKQPRSKKRSAYTKGTQCLNLSCTRYALLALLLCYLLTVFYVFTNSQEEKSDLRITSLSLDNHSLMTRRWMEEKEHETFRETRRLMQEKLLQRRQRIQPLYTTIENPLWYETHVLPSAQVQRNVNLGPTASIEDICGIHAQTAAIAYSDAYLAKNALNAQSRVIITGILHPLGYHLALALKQHCQAQVILGFDPMLPNTVKNRLKLIPQLAALTKYLDLEKPIINSFLGLDPQNRHDLGRTMEMTGETDLMQWKPTHIVHIAPPRYESQWENTRSAYIDAPWYYTRANQIAMEQILGAISQVDAKPHLLYVATDEDAPVSELLAKSYNALYGVSSVGLQLPDMLYGPFARSTIDHLLEALARNESVQFPTNGTDFHDTMFVEDALSVSLAAMQYHSSEQVLFDIRGEEMAALSHVTKLATSILHDQPFSFPNTSEVSQLNDSSQVYLGWKRRTTIAEGLKRSLAWQLDQLKPFGPDPRHNWTRSVRSITCAEHDPICKGGRQQMPCASECTTIPYCSSSAFDPIMELVQDISQGCDIVLYTQALDDLTVDLKMQAEYVEEGNPLICNFAFVSGRSKLVNSVIHKVPNSELARLGAVPRQEDSVDPNALHERIIDKLNGRLLYRGWILIWPSIHGDSLSHADLSLLKLSPGKFFHNDVKRAMFIEQNFPVTPTVDDIQFLVSEMHRVAVPQRTVKKKTPPLAKIRLPPEPTRRAVLLLPQLKYKDSLDYEALPPDTKISMREAVRFMRFESGHDLLSSEPAPVRKQREFYERIGSIVNKGTSLRSPSEPIYHYQLKHWARTRWVVHDLQATEARDLRCEWYDEHTRWEADLDQLSFAHVMAKRELDQRIASNSPDDRALRAMADKLELRKAFTDSHEWFKFTDKVNAEVAYEYDIQILGFGVDEKYHSASTPLLPTLNHTENFVRVISDRTMALGRKIWNHYKKAGVR